MLLVGFAGGGNNGILWKRQPAALEIFLQESFWILAQSAGIHFLEQWSKKIRNDFFGHCETAVEVNRSEQRLQRIGEYRWAFFSATFDFSLAESDQLAQFKPLRHFSKSLLIDQIGSYPRQVTFGKIGKMPEN